MVRSLPVLLAALAAASPFASIAASPGESYGRIPLQFEANQGQAHKDVRFLSRGAGYGLYLTSNEAVLALGRTKTESTVLRMSLVGAAQAPQVSGLDKLPGTANYFIGSDPAKWRRNVPTYAKVRYERIYPGIDLVYYGKQRQLEYDFVVAPGADPGRIMLGFKGAQKLEIDPQGDLVLHAKGEDIRQHKPLVYQEIDGVRREIEGGYVRKGANRVGFKVAAYDRSAPLVIDPVLSYSTYLGGSGNETGPSTIAVDAAGNAYVTGGTLSTDFPTTPGAFQTAFAGASNDGSTITGDVFVAKLNVTGTALIYSTYVGGRWASRATRSRSIPTGTPM